MKKLVSIITAFIMLCALIPSAITFAAENEGNYVFLSDFEDVEPGKKIHSLENVNQEVATLNNPNKIWNGIAGTYEVVKESETVNNQVLKVYNDESASVTTTFTKSLRTDVNNNGLACFDMSFKVKSNGQNCSISMLPYSSNIGTFYPFELSGMNVSCNRTVGGTLEMDKWNYVRVRVNLEENLIDLFINDIPEYTGTIWPKGETRKHPSMIVIGFNSTVTKGKECFWDDIMLSEAAASEEDVINDNFDLYKGIHPRVFLEEKDFDRIKKMTQDERFKSEWNSMLMIADRYVNNGPTEYWVDPDTEENWMRDEADWLLQLCVVAKVTGEAKYREALRKCIDTSMKYPHWGREEFLNNDLACTHMLVLSSVYYDWFYDDLTPDEKYLILNTVKERAGVMSKLGWWRIKYLQNHLWNCASALMQASAAFYEDIPEAKSWSRIAKNLYDNVLMYLGDDGASHEGLMYWGYGLRFLEYYIETAEKFLGLDYSNLDYIKNASRYLEAMYVETKAVPLSNFKFSDYAPYLEPVQVGNLMWLAGRNNDPLTKWYADYIRERVPEENKNFYTFAFFVFYADGVEAKSPQELNVPTTSYFHDLGLLFMRSNWIENETAIAYRCGPVLGKSVLNYNLVHDIGTDHVHNDVNSMQIVTRGENLLGETSYGGYKTDSHNTILVNNMGQIQDLHVVNGMFDDLKVMHVNPQITKIEENENYVYSIADGTNAYDRETTGLVKFRRHFLYLKPDILLVTDEIETEEREEKIPVEIRYFPEQQNYKATRDGAYNFYNTNYNFVIKPLETEGALAEATTVTKSPSQTSKYNATVVRIISEENKILQPVALSWSDPDKTPVDVTAKKTNNGVVEFYLDNQIITLDTVNEKVSTDSAGDDVLVKVDGRLKKATDEAFVSKNDRFFASSSQLEHYFGISAEKKDDSYVFSLNNKKAEACANSDVIRSGNKEIKMDTCSFVENGEIYVPIRFILQAFNIDCAFDVSKKTLNMTTNVDFSDASIYSLMVNGIFVPIEKGKTDYSLAVFGTSVDIQAVANVASATIDINTCEGPYGMSQFTITSADKSKNITYTVNTTPYIDSCGTTVYNFGVSSHDGNIGENTFDHELGTRWSASGEQYLWYDLGETREIDAVKIAFYIGNTRTTDFDIEISDDGVNYTKVAHFTSSGTTDQLEEFKLENAKARYVRYYGYGAKGSGWNSITEMGVVLKQ